jgi:hypothetical protein
VDSIQPFQDKGHWLARVKNVVKFTVPQNSENCLIKRNCQLMQEDVCCTYGVICLYYTETLKSIAPSFYNKTIPLFSFCGGTAQIGPRPPLCEVTNITHTHTHTNTTTHKHTRTHTPVFVTPK